GVDGKLAGLLKASKNLDNLIESQRSHKVKDGVGYNVVPPPTADLYLSPKKDLSWTGLPEFVDDTVTDYSRPSPTVASTSAEGQNKNSTTSEDVASPNIPKPFVKFVKPKDSQSKSLEFVLKKKSCFSCGDFSHLANDCRKRGSSQNNIDDKGYWDSGCSRHMTGNISYLSDFEPFDREYVSFGQGGCKITSKGTIKTGKLKFKNVYFVKDLKYNLFSVSQICDNKNSVLFTDLECIVLGRDFKLLDDANILLRGLPTKSFDNDHTCTVCLKGKQHKAPWIKREFSNARTPQQNGVAERRNRILIEAARTMLVDAKLPVTFWAEVVNTARYVQNRVLVNKSQNKTSYELFNGRTFAIGFLKPFGCHVMILNTLDNLGKFEAKGDEGTKDAANQEVKKDVSSLRYLALPNWVHDALLESSSSKPQDESSTKVLEGNGNPNPTASSSNPPADQIETLTVESPIPTDSSPVPTACLNDSPEPSSETFLELNQVQMKQLEWKLMHKSKEVEEQSFIATIYQKTDPALLQFCLFSCFLSQVEPKKVSDAL
nr:ribonuclease H-like domain-containing protein [Tanacetum cinerariifolium]